MMPRGMLDHGFGVKACPNCGCTHTHREYVKYDVGVKWLSIQMKDLHPISELSHESKKAFRLVSWRK